MAEDASAPQKAFSELTQKLQKPEEFALGSTDIRNAAIQATKLAFDSSIRAEPSSLKHINALLASLTPLEAPQTRSKAAAKASKPPPVPSTIFNPTPLASLFVDDLEDEQVWAQLDIRTKHICEVLDVVLEGELEDPDMQRGDADEEELMKALESGGFSFDGEDEDSEEDSEGDSEDESDEEEEESDEDEGMEEEGDSAEEETFEGMNDQDESDEDEDIAPTQTALRPPVRPRKQASEVDDDFFSLSSFKAEVERAEAKTSSRGHLSVEDDSDDESDFDEVDLFAPIEDEEDAEEEETKELFYADFFEPPRREVPAKQAPKAAGKGVRFNEEVRVKKIKPTGNNRPLRADVTEEGEDEDEDDEDEDAFGMEEDNSSGSGSESEDGEEDGSDDDSMDGQEAVRSTIDRLKDDLFADDEEDDDSQKDMTAHQKRMAALQEQIAELEDQNVSRKDWTLMGEADARSRPQNSLLEEDLEFDRVMKAVPVITEEKVQSLEELIKARILEARFDDVIRIRPMDDKAFLPSRILELQDTKSTQSLAQIYENDYMAAQGDGTKVDDRDGKLKKEHDEVELLWDKLCEKLDALSNAHFIPKQPKSIITTVSDVSTATIESALPTSKSATSMLAPEEVFSAAGSSQPRDRSELTPAEKRALRTKERKVKKKQRDLLDKTVDKTAKARSIGGVKKQKQAALESIVKHGKGVTVVGKSAKDLKASGKRPKKP